MMTASRTDDRIPDWASYYRHNLRPFNLSKLFTTYDADPLIHIMIIIMITRSHCSYRHLTPLSGTGMSSMFPLALTDRFLDGLADIDRSRSATPDGGAYSRSMICSSGMVTTLMSVVVPRTYVLISLGGP